jgi:Immunity protein 45
MQTVGRAEPGSIIAWCPLRDWASPHAFRGTVFRCLSAAWPYEHAVDFILVLDHTSPSGFELIVATGYKAGHSVVCPPADAKAPGELVAISTSWLIRNWTQWIYAECPVEHVRVIKHYPALVSIEGASPEVSRDLKV